MATPFVSGLPMVSAVRPKPRALVNASWWKPEENKEEEEEDIMEVTALVRSNPVPTSAVAAGGVAGAGFLGWRFMQRRTLMKDLEASPPFSALTPSQRKEIAASYLPLASIKTASKAREEIFGHPETWSEMLSRYVPGVTEVRETAADVREAVQAAAKDTKQTARGWADWAWQRSPFGGVFSEGYGDAYGSALVPIPGVGLMLTVAAAGLMWHRSKQSSMPAKLGKSAAIVILPFAPQVYLGYLGYQYIKNKV